MRYCRKCDKDFDNDCYFCSYCGEKLDYDEDRKPEGFLQGLNKRKWHLFNVAIMVIISMAPFWYRNVFAGKGTLYVLAYFSGFLVFTIFYSLITLRTNCFLVIIFPMFVMLSVFFVV